MATLSRNFSSIAIFICTCIVIVTAQSQNITRTANPATLSRQRTSVSQQRRGNDAQRGGIISQQRRITGAQRGGSVSQQRRGNDAQRGGIVSQQLMGNDAERGRIVSRQFRGNDAQRGGIISQERRIMDAQRGGSVSQPRRLNNAPLGGVVSQQRRVNDFQRDGIVSQQLTGNDAQRSGVVSQQRSANDVQRGGFVSHQRRVNDAQRGGIVSQQLGRNDAQRGGVIQLRRRIPQRRPVLNLQNLPQASGTIPRARSFQASLPNMVPRRDPRTGMMSRGTRTRNQPARRIISGSRLPRRSINRNFMCAAPRSVRCYSWPRNRDSRGAYVCDGGCQGRTCSVPCECSCVDPRLIGRLRAVGRISGPELTLSDTRLSDEARRQRLRNRILAMRAARRRQPPARSESSSNGGVRPNELPRRSTNADLNFGISDDVLATLIAQPVLNEIVGPQGINQIIAGEPPALLTREDRGQGSLPPSVTNEIPQPDIRAIRITPPRAQQRSELPVQDRSMGIPVPLSRINFDPGTEVNPAMGNMRVIMSDIRPFEDPTTGMNIDLPRPTPMDISMASAADNQVSVRQLPGTSVLFVDLTRSSPTGRMPGQRRISTLNNMTSSDLRSRTGNNVLTTNTNPSTNQTLPGSGLGGSVRTFLDGTVQTTGIRIRPQSQDECLAQRMELWCDPQKPWDGTPGLSRWCLLNCRADNCDNQRCACACIDEILFKTNYEQLSLPAP